MRKLRSPEKQKLFWKAGVLCYFNYIHNDSRDHLYEMILCAGLGARTQAVSLILTVICRILSLFCRGGNRNPKKFWKFLQALQVLRVRARMQAQVHGTPKPKCAPLCWAGYGINRHSVKPTAGRTPASFYLHVGSLAFLRTNGIYFKSVSDSISSCSGCHRKTYLWLVRVLRIHELILVSGKNKKALDVSL